MVLRILKKPTHERKRSFCEHTSRVRGKECFFNVYRGTLCKKLLLTM